MVDMHYHKLSSTIYDYEQFISTGYKYNNNNLRTMVCHNLIG